MRDQEVRYHLRVALRRTVEDTVVALSEEAEEEEVATEERPRSRYSRLRCPCSSSSSRGTSTSETTFHCFLSFSLSLLFLEQN